MKIYKIRLKKGDFVEVTRGRLKGQRGRITATHPKTNMVTVENLNIFKKSQKPNRQNTQGAIIDINKPINVSKLAIVDPKDDKISKIGYKFDKDGKKIRIYKRSKQEIQSKK